MEHNIKTNLLILKIYLFLIASEPVSILIAKRSYYKIQNRSRSLDIRAKQSFYIITKLVSFFIPLEMNELKETAKKQV